MSSNKKQSFRGLSSLSAETNVVNEAADEAIRVLSNRPVEEIEGVVVVRPAQTVSEPAPKKVEPKVAPKVESKPAPIFKQVVKQVVARPVMAQPAVRPALIPFDEQKLVKVATEEFIVPDFEEEDVEMMVYQGLVSRTKELEILEKTVQSLAAERKAQAQGLEPKIAQWNLWRAEMVKAHNAAAVAQLDAKIEGAKVVQNEANARGRALAEQVLALRGEIARLQANPMVTAMEARLIREEELAVEYSQFLAERAAEQAKITAEYEARAYILMVMIANAAQVHIEEQAEAEALAQAKAQALALAKEAAKVEAPKTESPKTLKEQQALEQAEAKKRNDNLVETCDNLMYEALMLEDVSEFKKAFKAWKQAAKDMDAKHYGECLSELTAYGREQFHLDGRSLR
jgi:hypothetical protein